MFPIIGKYGDVGEEPEEGSRERQVRQHERGRGEAVGPLSSMELCVSCLGAKFSLLSYSSDQTGVSIMVYNSDWPPEK